jgi:hypothetical protein
MKKENKLYNLFFVDRKVHIPEYWDMYREEEFRTQLQMKMPGFHFEFWYDAEDCEFGVGDASVIVKRMLEHKNATEVYAEDISGEEYTVFVIAFKD